MLKKNKAVSKLTSWTRTKADSREARMVASFFTQFATQIAFVCKQRIVYNIGEVASKNFAVKDYQIVVPWYNASKSSEIESLIENMVRVEDLQLTHYHRPLHQGEVKASRPDASVFTSHSTRERVAKIKEACPRFKRFYDSAILSVLRLSKLGYAMATPHTEKIQRQSTDLKIWLIIIQICDTFENIEPVEEESEYIEDNGENAVAQRPSSVGKIMRVVLNTKERSEVLDSEDYYEDFTSKEESLEKTLDQDVNSIDVSLRPFKYDRNLLWDDLFDSGLEFQKKIPIVSQFLEYIKKNIGVLITKVMLSTNNAIATQNNDDVDEQQEFARTLVESFEDTYLASTGDSAAMSAYSADSDEKVNANQELVDKLTGKRKDAPITLLQIRKRNWAENGLAIGFDAAVKCA